MVMTLRIDPDAAERIARLWSNLGDISNLSFHSSQKRVLVQIEQGERQPSRIAANAGLARGRVPELLWGIERKLLREEARRARVGAGVPFEDRPISDLELPSPVERRLVLFGSIQTIGELLKKSERDLRNIPMMGAGSIEWIRQRLWSEGGKTLLGSTPPNETGSDLAESEDGGTAHLLLPISVITAGVPSVESELLFATVLVLSGWTLLQARSVRSGSKAFLGAA